MDMNCVEVIHKDFKIAAIYAVGAKLPGEKGSKDASSNYPSQYTRRFAPAAIKVTTTLIKSLLSRYTALLHFFFLFNIIWQ